MFDIFVEAVVYVISVIWQYTREYLIVSEGLY